jgi:hypothetical protein
MSADEDRPEDEESGEAATGERALPVPAGARAPARGEVLDAPAGGPLDRLAAGPLAGPALAAAGGFLAGFATFVAARVLRGRGPRRLGARRRRRALERQIESSRSFLVDVHVLRR